LDATDEEIRIVVRDTGIGISETFRPALFGAFQQASSGYGRTHEGTGLGLAIVHRIVQLLGGEIDVESPEEGGTAFRVRLPRFDARAEQAETALLHREVRVLVVEAEERPLHRLRLLLQSQCQVVTAVGAEEALQMAQDGSFDLLVIDGHLPVEASDLPLL